MRPSRLSPLAAFLLACFVAMVWLNQGIKRSDAEAQAHAIDDPWHRPLNGARYGLLLLYMRTGDEELYHAVASALRGLPYDRATLVDRGRGTPAEFDRAPPVDRQWHRPYSEVPLEYPVALLPFLLLPSFFAGVSFEAYARLFSVAMAALLLGGAALAIRVQPARDRDARARAWLAVSGLLLAQGSLAVQRLDAVPAFLLALGLWAAAERRHATVGVALGLATAVKFLPVLLAAPLVAADWRTWATPRARVRGVVGFGAAAGIGLVPMLFPPEPLLGVLRYHAERGLQVESTWAVLLSTWRVVTGTAAPATVSYGSFNLDGTAADVFARLSMPVALVTLAALTVLLVRAPASEGGDGETARRDRLALALLAGLSALWLTAKVFSPQYLTWGLPLVLAVSGKLGRTLTRLLGAVMAVTQFNLIALYYQIVRLKPVGEIALWVRLALLTAFAFVVVRALGARATRPGPQAVPGPAGGERREGSGAGSGR
jgi:hypothetical protein